MLIEQVLINILENAVDHAVGLTRLILKVTCENELAHFRISDNGCGIPQDRMKDLFTGYLERGTLPTDSSRNNESDKVAALDLGANDYVTKPFGTAELLARIRAALRNRKHIEGISSLPGAPFTLHDLIIDYDRRQVTIGGKEIRLTQTEYNILALLSVHTGKVLTYAVIIREIWGTADSGSTKRLQVNMANIRKKLGSKPGDNRYIINELGVGYRMSEENL